MSLHMLLNPILNASQDIRHITLHIAVMKPHIQAKFLQALLSSLITFEFVAMAIAIDLNQFQLRAIEIHDVLVNGSLS